MVEKLLAKLPELHQRQRLQVEELEKFKKKAKALVGGLLSGDGGPGAVFMKEELDALGKIA